MPTTTGMEPPRHSDLTPIRAAHVGTLAPLLARAFDVDAAYRYLFPEERTRLRGLSDFFGRHLHTHLPYACTYALERPTGVVATVTIRPPGGVDLSMLTMLRRGLLPFAFAHGAAAVKRLLWLRDTYDELEALAADGQPHWYVHMMAVRPDMQGQGVGSDLLRRALESTANTQPLRRTILTTNLARNVVFYERAGFALVSERLLRPPNGAPYTVWSMVRGASATTA